MVGQSCPWDIEREERDADLPTKEISAGAMILFTIYWPDAKKWEGTDFFVTTAA
jgi:hypothetical protein